MSYSFRFQINIAVDAPFTLEDTFVECRVRHEANAYPGTYLYRTYGATQTVFFSGTVDTPSGANRQQITQVHLAGEFVSFFELDLVNDWVTETGVECMAMKPDMPGFSIFSIVGLQMSMSARKIA